MLAILRSLVLLLLCRGLTMLEEGARLRGQVQHLGVLQEPAEPRQPAQRADRALPRRKADAQLHDGAQILAGVPGVRGTV